MSDLPKGWVEVALGDVTEVRLGRQRSPKNHTGDHMRPYLRAANVTWAGLDLSDVKEMNFTDDEVATYRLEPGDVILSEASGSAGEVGKPALWAGEITDCCFQNTLIRVRGTGATDPRFLLHRLRFEALMGAWAGREARGVGIHHIGAKRLANWSFDLPPLPEQERIVAALELRLGHLEKARSNALQAQRTADTAVASVLNAVADGSLIGGRSDTWAAVSVGDVCAVRGGIQKQPKRRPAEYVFPFLRVANVGRRTLDLTEVHQIELFDGELERYRLQPGDLLVVEGNGSIDHIGRAASWSGAIDDCVHQNHLIRVRAGDTLAPEFLEMVWNAPSTTAQLRDVASTTSGLYTLSVGKLEGVKLRIPSLSVQRELVAVANLKLAQIQRAAGSISVVLRRIEALRRSLLNQAFSGELIPQSPGDTPAAELIEMLEAEAKTTRTPPTRKKRARHDR